MGASRGLSGGDGLGVVAVDLRVCCAPEEGAALTVAPKKTATPSPAAPTPSPGGHAGMPGM